MSKGKFYKSSKDHNTVLAYLNTHACTVAKKLMLKATCACCFVQCLGNLCNKCKTKSYVPGESSVWHLQYPSHGIRRFEKSALKFYSC